MSTLKEGCADVERGLNHFLFDDDRELEEHLKTCGACRARLDAVAMAFEAAYGPRDGGDPPTEGPE